MEITSLILQIFLLKFRKNRGLKIAPIIIIINYQGRRKTRK